MSLKRILVTLLVGLALVCPQILYTATNTNTVYYVVKLKSPQGDAGVRKVWVKGSNYRSETYIGKMPFRIVKNKSGVYMLHPADRYAAKYGSESKKDSPMSALPGPAGSVDAFIKSVNAKKAGQEKVGNKSCDVYTYTEKVTGYNCKMWVDPKSKDPVQLVILGKDNKPQLTATYVKFDVGIDIPDSKFELPKGITVRTMKSRQTTTKEPTKK